MELFSDAAGKFKVPGLAAGLHEIKVTKPGYVSEIFHVQIHHRGSLHGIRVDLVQVRVRLLEIYRKATLPLLPEENLWACWTPRELTRHVGSRAGRKLWPLENLTALLENAYWSSMPAEEEVLGRLHLHP